MLPRAASPTARHIPQHPDAVLLFDAEQPTCIDESAPGLALPMRHRVATIAAAADLLAGWPQGSCVDRLPNDVREN